MKKLLLLVLALLLVACSNGAPTSAPVTGASPSALEPGALQVIRPDGNAKTITMSELKAMPKVKITVEGIDQEGPALLEVLRVAGVTDFKRVTISGVGSVNLDKDQVNAQVMFDFNNRGSVKFAALNVPKANWPKDVTTIKVE